jgi:hypothetical protein
VKFRKRPLVVEAVQWTGKPACYAEVAAFMPGDHFIDGLCKTISILSDGDELSATPGDWIIKEVTGEYYPCNPELFAATYDVVEETPVSETAEFVATLTPEQVENLNIAVDAIKKRLIAAGALTG